MDHEAGDRFAAQSILKVGGDAWTLKEVAKLKAKAESTVSVALLASSLEGGIGATLRTLRALQAAPSVLIDELVVVIGARAGVQTTRTFEASGATTIRTDEFATSVGLPGASGRGLAIAAGIAGSRGDLIVFLDGGLTRPSGRGGYCPDEAMRRHVLALLRPALADSDVHVVRPAFGDHARAPKLTFSARSVLSPIWPALATLSELPANEFAVTRRFAQTVSMPTDAGADVALLIDALAHLGPRAIVEVELATRLKRRPRSWRSQIEAEAQLLHAAVARVARMPRPSLEPTVVASINGTLERLKVGSELAPLAAMPRED